MGIWEIFSAGLVGCEGGRADDVRVDLPDCPYWLDRVGGSPSGACRRMRDRTSSLRAELGEFPEGYCYK